MRRAYAVIEPASAGPAQLRGVVDLWQSLDTDVGGVVAQIYITGVPRGLHGFHAHNDADHLHLQLPGEIHGALGQRGGHLGDFGNLESTGPGGDIKDTLLLQSVSLIPGHPRSLLGHSLVLHAEKDDLGEFRATCPASAISGNSGPRIAHGKIIQWRATSTD